MRKIFISDPKLQSSDFVTVSYSGFQTLTEGFEQFCGSASLQIPVRIFENMSLLEQAKLGALSAINADFADPLRYDPPPSPAEAHELEFMF